MQPEYELDGAIIVAYLLCAFSGASVGFLFGFLTGLHWG